MRTLARGAGLGSDVRCGVRVPQSARHGDAGLAYDGQGFWLCHKRLSQGGFRYWPSASGQLGRELLAHELQVLLAGRHPEATQAAPQWRPITPSVAA